MACHPIGCVSFISIRRPAVPKPLTYLGIGLRKLRVRSQRRFDISFVGQLEQGGAVDSHGGEQRRGRLNR